MKILMVLTSHDKFGDTGEKTGFWLEEFAAPYYVFKDAGAEMTLASPKGGLPPIDPRSETEDAQTAATKRFQSDSDAKDALANTAKLAEVDTDGFDAVFYPGGHGPLWDLATDEDSKRIIQAFAISDRPVGAVCHAPAALLQAQNIDGKALISGRTVTGFSNSEESAVGLTEAVPYLLEDEMKKLEGHYEKGDDFTSYVVSDRNLVTGQNPASSEKTAQELLKLVA